MPDDPYEGLAERYDLFYERLDAYPEAEVGFFRDVLAQVGCPPRVLDCACGTGRYLPLLHALGCDVVGLDISPAMLARARENLTALDPVLADLDDRIERVGEPSQIPALLPVEGDVRPRGGLLLGLFGHAPASYVSSRRRASRIAREDTKRTLDPRARLTSARAGGRAP